MDNSLTNKYYLKIKSNILSYALMLKELVILKESKIIVAKKDFESLYRKAINIFYDQFIFDSEKANLKVSQYFDIDDDNPLVDNQILASIIVYYETIEKLSYLKDNKTFLVTMALILSLAYEVSEMANPFLKNTANIPKYIIKRLKEIDKLSYIDIDLDNEFLDDIAKEAQEDNLTFIAFFKSFNNPVSYNTFTPVSEDEKYYLVSYKYTIPDLSKYSLKEVNKYRGDDIEKSLFYISSYLLSMTILKERIVNSREKYFLLNIGSSLYKNANLADTLKKIFEKTLRPKLYLLIKEEDYVKEKTEINKLAREGFKIMIDLETSDFIETINESENIEAVIISSKIKEEIIIDNKNIKVIKEKLSRKILKNNF